MNIRQEAAELCRYYNWPEQADLIECGKPLPSGFGREIGSFIVAFMATPPLAFWLLWESRKEDRWHGKRLARLRLLVARINCEERRNRTENSIG